ncbi:hypothetical protein KM043_013081 [Ampulex compressa]|nr:hypothetical protein KM043_013081 [Ampulex compressa]
MTDQDIDFVLGSASHIRDKTQQDLTLCRAYPIITNEPFNSNVLTKNGKNPRELNKNELFGEDGLYTSDSPLTYHAPKPYKLHNAQILNYDTEERFSGKLLEIAVRRVKIYSVENQTDSEIQITSVSILFRKKVICKANVPFNRKLYKVLIRNTEFNSLSIQVQAKSGQSSILPLPLPKRCVRDSKIEIDFAISDSNNRIYAGTVTCTISISNHGPDQQEEHSTYLYKLSNDPNDPQNNLSLLRPQKTIHEKQVKYFLLQDPVLQFDTAVEPAASKIIETEKTKPPDIVITEQSTLSLLNLSFRNLFQARRPLRPSSGTRRHHMIGKTILTITVLRGVEVPVREESALVQPLIEVEWSNVTHTTSIADGPAPIWQQTLYFELPRQNGENCIKFRLYDQHPVWGQQWLGEARIPLEYHKNYQELERWITLSPIFSPVLLFGYVQASPGQSCTRIYILMKMEQPGNAKSLESNAINTLLKSIQRCLAVPYKIAGIETPEDAARLAMLLSPLPIHYGPIMPRQALNLNKIDHYGRAALLASLLEALNLETYVLLGSSQTSRWTAFTLSISTGENTILWDPEIGDHCNLGDSRCPLIKVSRIINHYGIWENLQRSILPHNLKYDVKANKDWRPIGAVASSSTTRSPQTLEFKAEDEEELHEKQAETEMEEYLQDKLSHLRSELGLTTTFNRHVTPVLRNFVSRMQNTVGQQLDKKDLKQLFRAYHTHGFVLNLRKTSLEEMAEQLTATKVQHISGPVEFALICRVQHYVGRTCSIWLALMILRDRD